VHGDVACSDVHPVDFSVLGRRILSGLDAEISLKLIAAESECLRPSDPQDIGELTDDVRLRELTTQRNLAKANLGGELAATTAKSSFAASPHLSWYHKPPTLFFVNFPLDKST